MAVKLRSWFSNQTVRLGLCVSGVVVIIAVLVNFSPLGQNSVYKPPAPAHKVRGLTYNANHTQLAFNDSQGQSFGPASSTSGQADLGVSAASSENNSGDATQQATPGYGGAMSAPGYTGQTPPANNDPASQSTSPPAHDFFMPSDPLPPSSNSCQSNPLTKFSSCMNCYAGCGACGGRGTELMCISPL